MMLCEDYDPEYTLTVYDDFIFGICRYWVVFLNMVWYGMI